MIQPQEIEKCQLASRGKAWYDALNERGKGVRAWPKCINDNPLSAQEKLIVEDRLHMHDSLLEQDPFVHEQRDFGKIEGQQKAILIVVETRFPALVEMAQERIVRLNKPDELNL